MNFRLESIYLGAVPVVLALLAWAWALPGRKPTADHGPRTTDGGLQTVKLHYDILFWGAVALVTLLLAYGKYFPLYGLFYKLPVIHDIRNPNKMLQVFQVAMGILAAYGLDVASGLLPAGASGEAASGKGEAAVPDQARR